MTVSQVSGKRRVVPIAWGVIIMLSMVLGLETNTLADELDNVSGDENAALMERSAAERTDEATRCFAQVKSNGTVWLPTQSLYDELIRIRASSDSEGGDSIVSQQVKSLSDTILEHCELIENQHALERARYLLTTLKEENTDEVSVRAVRDMLLAADGQGALRLVEGLLSQTAAVAD